MLRAYKALESARIFFPFYKTLKNVVLVKVKIVETETWIIFFSLQWTHPKWPYCPPLARTCPIVWKRKSLVVRSERSHTRWLFGTWMETISLIWGRSTWLGLILHQSYANAHLPAATKEHSTNLNNSEWALALVCSRKFFRKTNKH